MANTHALIYDLPSDQVTGTWSQTGGTVNALYPLTRLDDGKPWNPTIFTANPTRITIDFGSAKRVDLVSFAHVNFDLGAVIHAQMNASNSWSSPSLDTAVVIAGPAEDGMPANPFVDLTPVSGYSGSGFRYLSLQVVSGQVSLLSFGLIRVTKVKRQITGFASTGVRNRDWGGTESEKHPLIERVTDAGVQLGYSRGTRARFVNGSVRCVNAGWADLVTWTRSTRGRSRPCLLVPDPTVNEALWVKWGASADMLLKRTTFGPSAYDVPVDWEEVGRGLAP